MWMWVGALAVGGLALGIPFAVPPPAPNAAPAPPPIAHVVWRLLLGLVLSLYLADIALEVWLAFGRKSGPAFLGHDGGSSGLFLSPVQWLIQHRPRPEALRSAYLRVEAALQIPVLLSAYLYVAWLLDREAAHRIAAGPLGFLAAVVWTGLLFLTDGDDLRTPFDVFQRAAGLVLTVPLLLVLGGWPMPAERPGYWRLLLFLVRLCALVVFWAGVNIVAVLSMTSYGLPTSTAWAIDGGLLVGAFLVASGQPARPEPASAFARVLHAVARRFMLLVCVPALPIVCGLFGGSYAGAGSALSMACVLAVMLGVREVVHPPPAGG